MGGYYRSYVSDSIHAGYGRCGDWSDDVYENQVFILIGCCYFGRHESDIVFIVASEFGRVLVEELYQSKRDYISLRLH